MGAQPLDPYLDTLCLLIFLLGSHEIFQVILCDFGPKYSHNEFASVLC